MYATKPGSGVKAFVTAVMLGSGLVGSASAQTVDTTTGWKGTDKVDPWGPGGFPTFGQTFATPSSRDALLSSATIYISNPNNQTPFSYQAYIYEWDGSKISGTALYSSSVISTSPGTAYSALMLSAGGYRIVYGKEYVLFVTSTSVNNSGNLTNYAIKAVSGNPYSGGQVVYSGEGSFNNLSTTSWSMDYYSDYDLALVLNFSPVPPDASNTRTMISVSASGVRNQLIAREAVLTSSLGYDSNEFGKNNISVSFVGRYTGLSDSTSEGAGALVAAYKVHPNVRLGAFVDYAPLRDAPTGIKHGDAQPTLGAFAVYEQNKDLTGLSTRVAAAYDYGRMTVTRDASLADTEAGSGKAGMRSYAFSAEAGYGIRLAETVVAVPYLGIRYTDVTRKGYSEGETTDVTEPLTYNDYGQRLTTALGGVRFHGKFGEKVSAFVGLGAEFDMIRKMDAYSGTSGITDLETFSVATNSHPNRLRASASAGIGYQVAANQSISAQVSVRQQAYSADPSVTSMVKYSMGF